MPHPRRATGSRQMLRPIAGAMIRSSAISRSNCAGNIDCAPSRRTPPTMRQTKPVPNHDLKLVRSNRNQATQVQLRIQRLQLTC